MGKLRFPPEANIFIDEYFLTLNKGQQNFALSQWNLARTNRNMPRVNPPAAFFGPQHVTQRPHLGASNDAVSYEDMFGHNINLENMRVDNNINPDEDSQLASVLNLLPPSSSSTDQSSNKRPASPTPVASGSKIQKPNPEQQREVDASVEAIEMADNPVLERPPATAAATAAKGKGKNVGSASDGGFDSSQGPINMIRTSKRMVSPGIIEYTAVHHLKGFGSAMTPIIQTNDMYIPTSLNEIPWRFPFLYMSPNEFIYLQGQQGSEFIDCGIDVSILNCSTSFVTGSTLSTITSHQHPKIGILGVDLERKIRGGSTGAVTIGANMVPTGIVAADWQTFINYQWGKNQTSATWDTDPLPGTSYPFIYHMYNNFIVKNVSKAGYTALGPTAVAMGHEFLASSTVQFNINDKMWDQIYSTHYTFSSSPIGTLYKAIEIAGPGKLSSVGNSNIHLYNQSATANLTSTAANYAVSLSAAYNESNYKRVNYTDLMEMGALNARGNSVHKPARQHTVHFGIKQIPKVDAGVGSPRADAFVLCDVYYYVVAKCRVRLGDLPNRFTMPTIASVNVEQLRSGSTLPKPVHSDIVTFGLK
jgi:hypothetical protein